MAIPLKAENRWDKQEERSNKEEEGRWDKEGIAASALSILSETRVGSVEHKYDRPQCRIKHALAIAQTAACTRKLSRTLLAVPAFGPGAAIATNTQTLKLQDT